MVKVNDRPKFKWKLSEADWESYSDEMGKNIPKNSDKLDIDHLERKFIKSILKSAKKHIGKKKIDQRTKPWKTLDIKHAIRTRNELRNDGDLLRLRKSVRQSVEGWPGLQDATTEHSWPLHQIREALLERSQNQCWGQWGEKWKL